MVPVSATSSLLLLLHGSHISLPHLHINAYFSFADKAFYPSLSPPVLLQPLDFNKTINDPVPPVAL